MSKERAQRRAERELIAEQRRSELATARDKQRRRQRAADRRSRRRRQLASSVGLRSTASPRVKERRAMIASALLVVVVLTYLMTRSIGMVIGVFLIAAIATPALLALFSDRSNR